MDTDIFELRRLDLLDLQKKERSFANISKQSGIDPGYISRCAYPEGKKGKKNIGDETVANLDKYYPGWRKRELEFIGVAVGESSKKYHVNKIVNPDIVTIPQYKDVRAAMGDSAYLLDESGEIIDWQVSRAWASKLPSNTGVKNLRIVTGFGPSMKGMFNSGDPLIVDSGVRSVDYDAVYFFRVGNEGFIKILQRIPGQGILVISKNPDNRDWFITEDMDFEVFGRILKAWQGTDL